MHIIIFITTLIEMCAIITFIVICYTYISLKCCVDERQQKINELIQDKYKNRYHYNPKTNSSESKYGEYVIIDVN